MAIVNTWRETVKISSAGFFHPSLALVLKIGPDSRQSPDVLVISRLVQSPFAAGTWGADAQSRVSPGGKMDESKGIKVASIEKLQSGDPQL